MSSSSYSSAAAAISSVFVTFKHQMGRHNQKRHGWRYGRNSFPAGSQMFDETVSQAIRMGRRAGHPTELSEVEAARRIVAARHSMRSTPEAGERAVYRKRSDLPKEITHGIPRRPAAAAPAAARPTTYEHVTAEGRRVRVTVPGSTPTPTATVAAPMPRIPATRPLALGVPKPKPSAVTEATAPPVSSRTPEAFRAYWSAQGTGIDTTDAKMILEAAAVGGIPNVSGFIKKTFTYKDDETGLHTNITDIDTTGSTYSGSRKTNMITVSGRVWDANGEPVGFFTRSLNTATMDMHHNLFELNSEWQGSGFGSRFYQHTERNYTKVKVKSVSLLANLNVGGYAWARMGFNFASRSDFNKYHDNAIMAWKTAYGKPYAGPALKNSWDIAALKGPDGRAIGKQVLLGSTWDGIKNLTKGAISRYVGEKYYRSKATKGKTPKG